MNGNTGVPGFFADVQDQTRLLCAGFTVQE
jgi:hypothetical protein